MSSGNRSLYKKNTVKNHLKNPCKNKNHTQKIITNWKKCSEGGVKWDGRLKSFSKVMESPSKQMKFSWSLSSKWN